MQQMNIAVLGGKTSIRESLLIQILWITGFAMVTAVGAQVEIPHLPVPYTLQTFFVLLSGALLGKRNGFFSQSLYLIAGAIGIPVFSHFGFGVARLLGSIRRLSSRFSCGGVCRWISY